MSTSTSILVGYATRYGSTQEVAGVVAEVLREGGLEVDLQLLSDVRSLEGCRALVMGAPLFMFRWHKDAHRFLEKQRKALESLPVAVFVLGPVHDPYDAQEWQASKTQLDKELAKHPWFKPQALEIFGGKYAPEKLRPPLSWFAGEVPPSDIRDWGAIRAWASGLAQKLGSGSPSNQG